MKDTRTFLDIYRAHPQEAAEQAVNTATADQVEAALASPRPSINDFARLISPAAQPFLEDMARRANSITRQRFGRVVSLFTPLYISNFCSNSCTYCGFNRGVDVKRRTLDVDEVMEEAGHLAGLGFSHLLLVSGENPDEVSIDYLEEIVKKLKPSFASIALEIYPLDEDGYSRLSRAGADGLIVYQETYDEKLYRKYHPAGKKRDFAWRLATPERGGQAGLFRLGIGALLGLADWRLEGYYLALHAQYLMHRFWKSHITVSFPRLRPAAGSFKVPHPVSDTDLVQLITALRICFPDAGLVLSTRETASLRDNLVPLGITTMSAGSCTEPGGYTHAGESQPQFDIADHRSLESVSRALLKMGYEPVKKDWDALLG